jgi:hypothetical protein
VRCVRVLLGLTRVAVRAPYAPPSPAPPCPRQGIKAAAAELNHLDGVTTFCEMAVPLVARLAEALGVPGNTPEAVDAARDKVCVCVCACWRACVLPVMRA